MARSDRSTSESHRTISGEPETDDSDLPPDSIFVPITANTQWQYSAYDSGESSREITNPKSRSKPFPWTNRVAATNVNATTPAPIMGIPATIKLPAFAHFQSPPSIFPRWRNSRSKKTALAYSEPCSPKVSCWGSVLSEREKEKLRKQKEARKEAEKEKETSSCCTGFSKILACGGDRGAGKRDESRFQLIEVGRSPADKFRPQPAKEVRRSTEKEDLRCLVEGFWRSPDEAGQLVAPQSTGLGAVKKFSSGRRDASWGADVVAEKERVVESLHTKTI